MKLPWRIRSTMLTLLLLSFTRVASAQHAPLLLDAGAAEKIKWWRNARFGMFIHWGLYAIPARGEWVQWHEQIPVTEYAKLADQFNPERYDPVSWAELARQGGMKYMVLTSRHHDGFALFDDPGNDFTTVKSTAHRDMIADYVKAVRGAGLGVGLYYSC